MTLRKIAAEAKKTDQALVRAGKNLDKIGSTDTTSGLAKAEASVRKVTAATEGVSKSSEKAARGVRGLGDAASRTDREGKKMHGSWGRIETMFRKLIVTTTGLAKVFMMLKMPLMIAGVAALIPVVAALGAGVVALIPRIVDLAGAAAPMPALFLGMGLSMVTVKLATKDLGKALSGNAEALKALTPEARRFVETLKSWKSETASLRRAAQQGLFPGLEDALGSLKRGVPVLRGLMRQFGQALGGSARDFAKMVTQPRALSQFASVGKDMAQIMSRVGRIFGNLVLALFDFMKAAMPFTKWMARSIENWSEWVRGAARAGNETGRIAKWLDRTKESMQTFGRIAKDLWAIFRNIGAAARPLGDSLYGSIEKTVRKWREFTEGISGRMGMMRFFRNSKQAIHEVMGLIGDLSKALGRLSGNTAPGVALVRGLRRMVPTLERMLKVFQTMAPGFVGIIEQLLALMEKLVVGGSSPFMVFLGVLEKVLKIFNTLLEVVPLLGHALAGMLAVGLVAKFTRYVVGLATAWRGVATAAVVAAEAETVASTVSGGGGVAGKVGKAGKLGRIGMLARGASGGPVMMAAMAGLVGYELLGNVGGPGSMAQNGVDRVAARSRPTTDALMASRPTTIAELESSAVDLRGQRRKSYEDIQWGKDVVGEKPSAQTLAYQQSITNEINMREALIKQLKGERIERRRARGTSEGMDIVNAYKVTVGAKGADKGAARNKLIAQYREEFAEEKTGAGKRSLSAQLMKSLATLEPGKEKTLLMKRARQAIESEYKKIGQNVNVVNQTIRRGSLKEWETIRKALGDKSQRAAAAVNENFTALQKSAMGTLTAMGIPVGAAKKLVMQVSGETAPAAPIGQAEGNRGGSGSEARATAIDKAGGAFAGGGRIGGFGLQDTVPIAPTAMAAPGEMVVNRHTEHRLNKILRRFGTSLESEVSRETLPHSAAVAPGMAGDILPGLSRGGRFAHGGRIGEDPGDRRSGGGGGSVLDSAISEASRIDALKLPYTYGGGHGTPAPANGPFDCSSSTSRVLQAAGVDIPTQVSQAFLNFGKPGQGALTVAVRPGAGRGGHVYMILNGRAWGTSGENPGGGPGWINSYVARPGFVLRHLPEAGEMAGLTTGGGEGGGEAQQIDPLKPVPTDTRGIPGILMTAIAKAQAAAMTQMINKRLKAAGPVGGGGTPTGGGGVGDWIRQAMGIAGVSGSGWYEMLMRQAQRESGGNPRAVNNWDSNAKKGTPSKGLLQTIDSTFNAYAEPGMNDIFNPVDNATAAIKYMIARYGGGNSAKALSSMMARGGSGYELGGRIGNMLTTPDSDVRVTQNVNVQQGGTMNVTVNVNGGDPGEVRRVIEGTLMDVAARMRLMPVGGEA